MKGAPAGINDTRKAWKQEIYMACLMGVQCSILPMGGLGEQWSGEAGCGWTTGSSEHEAKGLGLDSAVFGSHSQYDAIGAVFSEA